MKHWPPLVQIVVQEHTVNREFAAAVKQENIKIVKEKVRVNYALKAATGQRQVQIAVTIARRVQLENTMVQRVARPMSARIV